MDKKTIILQVPDIGEANNVELISWSLREGESFKEGDEICDFVTDKAVFTLDAPQKGILVRHLQPAKTLVSTGQEIAEIRVFTT